MHAIKKLSKLHTLFSKAFSLPKISNDSLFERIGECSMLEKALFEIVSDFVILVELSVYALSILIQSSCRGNGILNLTNIHYIFFFRRT